MAFFDKLTDAAATIGDKAGDMIEITKLKSKINNEKKSIESELANIGRIYYEKSKAKEEIVEEALGICAMVDAHYMVIEETETKLSDLEGK